MPRPVNPYARAYADFRRNTQHHELHVLHDDGLYRHLRVQGPRTRMWSWDVTTWPGHLATSGDIASGHVFAREPDMLAFFSHAGKSEGHYTDGAPSISVGYWAEKIQGRDLVDVKRYDPDSFLQQVREHLEEHDEIGTEAGEFRDRQIALLTRIHELRGLDEDARAQLFEAHWAAEESCAALDGCRTTKVQGSALRQERHEAARSALSALWSVDGIDDEAFDALVEEHDYRELADLEVPRLTPAERREEILDDARSHADSDPEARMWLAEHEDEVGSDTWEWDLREYDVHFLFACYALDLTARLWNEHVERRGVNDTYVLVRQGRVQNRPAQPVIDVSILDRGAPDASMAAGALDARERIMAMPQAREELRVTVHELTELVREHGDESARARLNQAIDREMAAAERALDHREIRADWAAVRAEREERALVRPSSVPAHPGATMTTLLRRTLDWLGLWQPPPVELVEQPSIRDAERAQD
jgi:hypothetical protein